MTEPPPPSRHRLRRYVPLIVGVVLTVVCAVFIVKVLVDDWAQVSDKIANASPGWLIGGLVLAALGMTVIAFTWADALAVMGGSMPRGRSIAWYYVGEIAKYLPGSIWAAVGRGEIARRRGIPANQAYPSVVLSLIALYIGGVLTAAVVLPFELAGGSGGVGPALGLLLLVPVGLAALHPQILGRLLGLVERITKRSLKIRVPPWRDSVLLVVRYVPAWVAISVSTWCVAQALPGVDAPLLRLSLAMMLSWTAGFVTPTPGGAGVREAVFAATCGLAAGPAVAIAVTSRIIFVLVDVSGAFAGLPFVRRSERPPGLDPVT